MGRIYKINTTYPYTPESLEQEAKRTEDGRYRLRLTVIAQILRNPSIGSKTLHQRYLVSKESITNWLKRYNTGGMEGLRHTNLGGRPEGNPIWDSPPSIP